MQWELQAQDLQTSEQSPPPALTPSLPHFGLGTSFPQHPSQTQQKSYIVFPVFLSPNPNTPHLHTHIHTPQQRGLSSEQSFTQTPTSSLFSSAFLHHPTQKCRSQHSTGLWVDRSRRRPTLLAESSLAIKLAWGCVRSPGSSQFGMHAPGLLSLLRLRAPEARGPAGRRGRGRGTPRSRRR